MFMPETFLLAAGWRGAASAAWQAGLTISLSHCNRMRLSLVTVTVGESENYELQSNFSLNLSLEILKFVTSFDLRFQV